LIGALWYAKNAKFIKIELNKLLATKNMSKRLFILGGGGI